MLGNAIAVDALCNFCVQQILFCTSASTADARLGINDDVVSLDQSCLDQKAIFSYKLRAFTTDCGGQDSYLVALLCKSITQLLV